MDTPAADGDEIGRLRVHYRTTEGGETGVQSSVRFDDNEWHHVVAIKDNESEKILLYVDGYLEGEQSIINGDTDSNQGLIIGSGHLGRYMDVTVDEVAVLSMVLPPGEVEEIYNLEHTPHPMEFEMYYSS